MNGSLNFKLFRQFVEITCLNLKNILDQCEHKKISTISDLTRVRKNISYGYTPAVVSTMECIFTEYKVTCLFSPFSSFTKQCVTQGS